MARALAYERDLDGERERHPRDPRVAFANHRERGPKRWGVVTYPAVASAAGVTVAAVKRAQREGRVDLRDLASVAGWIVQSATKAARRRRRLA